MSEIVLHVRCARATYRRYEGLTDRDCIAWCGEEVLTGQFFLDAEHAAAFAKITTSAACADCVTKIVAALLEAGE